jgi:hypothetical protein
MRRIAAAAIIIIKKGAAIAAIITIIPVKAMTMEQGRVFGPSSWERGCLLPGCCWS